MRMSVDDLKNVVIGRLLDNRTEVIEIDISAWRKRYPALTRYHLEVIAPDGTEYLPAAATDGDILRWVVTGSDTAHAGRGSWKVVGEGPDGERKSSDTILLIVRDSMAGFTAENPPVPMIPYVRAVVAAANRADAAAERAEDAADDAEKMAPVVGENGNWYTYDVRKGEYVDTGKPSRGAEGPQGVPGPAGPQGEKGEKGEPGEGGAMTPATKEKLGGVIAGKNLLIERDGTISVDTADDVEGDNTRPITASAVHAAVGNIEILLRTI